MKLKFLLMLLLFGGTLVSAQEVQFNSAAIATAGVGSAKGTINISKWSLGEIHLFVLPTDQTNLKGEEIIPESEITSDVKAYPNPFREVINLQFMKEYPGEFTIHVTDLTGKVQWKSANHKAVAGDVIKVDLSQLDTAVYLVYIISKDNETMLVFKVQKL